MPHVPRPADEDDQSEPVHDAVCSSAVLARFWTGPRRANHGTGGPAPGDGPTQTNHSRERRGCKEGKARGGQGRETKVAKREREARQGKRSGDGTGWAWDGHGMGEKEGMAGGAYS
jgi:hypothetical protein